MALARATDVRRDLLIWEAFADWRLKIGRLLTPTLKSKLKQHLRQFSPVIGSEDTWKWIGSSTLCNQLEEAEIKLAASLANFRCCGYHGCRPTNFESYFQNGIRRLNSDHHAAALWNLIMTDPRLHTCRQKDQFSKLKREFMDGIDNGYTYLALDFRFMKANAGHYLIWGSELWSAMLLHLGGDPARQVLKTIGVPTVFTVHFPLSFISESTRLYLARTLLHVWVEHLQGTLDELPPRDFSFRVPRDIEPQWITGHFHPAIVPYPCGLGHGAYDNPYLICQACRPGTQAMD